MTFFNVYDQKVLEDVFKTCLQDVFKTCLQDVLWDVFKTSSRLQDAFKTSWKMKNSYAEDVLKTSSKHVLKTFSRRLEDQQIFAGKSIDKNISTKIITVLKLFK